MIACTGSERRAQVESSEDLNVPLNVLCKIAKLVISVSGKQILGGV